MMELDSILICAECQSEEKLQRLSPGGYECRVCRKQFPTVDGIPRFVKDEWYAANFGYEWNAHRRTQLDTATQTISEQTLRDKTGLSPEDVKGKLVLDVGCGMGRFADVISRWGGKVVGVDLSSAVEAAHSNLKDRENVAIVQADLFRLPFLKAKFDVIYSIGVLHHTPDCEKAFRSIVPFLKPGGKIAIWLYDRAIVWGRVPQLYWRITRRMNPRILHKICKLAGPLYPVVTLPGIGKILWRILPIDTNPDPDWRILDTFDWYSARYRSWHTDDQVHSWFASEGLTQIRHLPVPVSVSGVRPSL